jgi:predicted Fe-S protein YdhL (DUF1289 family)
MAVVSPCVKNCKIEKRSCQKSLKSSKMSGVCVGCRRTLEEIAGWSKFSDERKLEILNEIETNPCRWKPTQSPTDVPVLTHPGPN